MNTKVYKAVHDLAEKLMAAANKNDTKQFESLYAELKAICIENENTAKDHPVQWETLSVAFSMATLQLELGDKEAAIKNLQDAKISANKIEDKELKSEIHELLESLVEEEG